MSSAVAKSDNPFTPTFGVVPACWAGRDELLRSLREALATGPTHPGFTSLVLGKRGTGKTTLQHQLMRTASESGWVPCRVDALLPSIPQQSTARAIVDEANSQMGQFLKPQGRRTKSVQGSARVGVSGVASVGLSGGMSSTTGHAPGDLGEPPARPVQHALYSLHDAAVKKKKLGVLLLIDEFHNLHEEDASMIASAVQNAKLSDRSIGFLGAGLEVAETTLLANPGFTFFRRCDRQKTDVLAEADSRRALLVPLESCQIEISDHLLARAGMATGGHPFAIQSLGSHLWRLSHKSKAVSESALCRAIQRMSKDYGVQIVGPAWSSLTQRQQRFLQDMVSDSDQTRVSDLAQRLGTTRNAVNELRHRLIKEEWIRPAGHGLVQFANAAIRDIAVENNRLAASNGQPLIEHPHVRQPASEPPATSQPTLF